MKTPALILLAALSAAPAWAQLSQDQKAVDFQSMAAMYAKRYAPYEWKKQAFNYDLLKLGPWLDRVRNATSDLEYLEICMEYVAGLQDTHSQFQMSSYFAADLGLSVDIYDGRVLIEAVNRAVLPASQFPFQVGDELVSVDGKSSEDWIAEFSRFRKWGSPLTTRRYAADSITFRAQAIYPRAIEVGDTATVAIRRDSGDLETYTLPWTKSGFPVTQIGPVPSPTLTTQRRRAEAADTDAVPDYMRPLMELQNWRMPDDPRLTSGETWDEATGQVVPRRYLLSLGSRTPAFAMPSGFVQRLGRSSSDFHFSGTYDAGGHKIGYIRVPNFSPTVSVATREIATEIAYMQANTDGLVIDIMRNPGGGCYMQTLASYLIPNNFYFFGEYIRVTVDRINSMQSALDSAKAVKAEQWVIDLYTEYLKQLKEAYAANRGMTGSIPACGLSFDNSPATDSQGNMAAYTKPLIILVDEFSISAADIFPSMMQDNQRGLLVGMRTSGGGGSVSAWPLAYSEALFTNTNSLVIRKNPIVTPDLPTAPYVENIGARPDVQLDYMTRDNLMNRGRSFVDAFTKILLDQIAAGK